MKETPEDCFDMGGYTKENIYRLGSIFYKLAHFEPDKLQSTFVSIHNLFTDLSSIESSENEVKIDWNHEKHENIHPTYNKLIKNCLSKKPETRPDIDGCIRILQEIKSSNIF